MADPGRRGGGDDSGIACEVRLMVSMTQPFNDGA